MPWRDDLDGKGIADENGIAWDIGAHTWLFHLYAALDVSEWLQFLDDELMVEV